MAEGETPSGETTDSTHDDVITQREAAGAKKVDGVDEYRYPESYVKKLTTENASRRLREKEQQTKLEEMQGKLREYEDRDLAAETDLKKKLEALEKRSKQSESEYQARIKSAERRFIASEAKRLAREAGIIDPDDVSVMEFADLRVGDDNTVEGLADKIGELKQNKPHWFKSAEVTPEKPVATKTVATPGRKEAAEGGKDWAKAPKEEVAALLRSHGVMA